MDKDEAEIPEELREAIAEASRYLGVGGAPGEAPDVGLPERPAAGVASPAAARGLRYDSSVRRWVRPVVLGVVLVATLAGSTWLSLRSREPLPPGQEEVDLRWAVARVVRRVEALRAEHGRLPQANDLYGLLGRAVTYLPSGDRYRVVGEWGGVRVVYDGSVPLDIWIARSSVGKRAR